MRNLGHSLIVAFVVSLLAAAQTAAQWQQTQGPYGGKVNLVWATGSTLFAGTDVGVYRSTDRGGSWGAPALSGTGVYAFINVGTTILAGTADGIYRTTNLGVTWDRPAPGLQATRVNAFSTIPASGGPGAKLFAGTQSGLFRSVDGGANWTLITTFPDTISTGVFSGIAVTRGAVVCALASYPTAAGKTMLVAGCGYLSNDWLSYGDYTHWQDIKDWDVGDLYTSKDEGATWKKQTYTYTIGASPVLGGGVTIRFKWATHTGNRSLQTSGNRLFGRFLKSQSSTTAYYLSADTGFAGVPYIDGTFLSQSGIINSNLSLVDGDGFLCRVDSSVTDASLLSDPVQTTIGFVGEQANSLARIPGVAGTDELYVATNDRGILKSTDNGKTWGDANSGIILSDISALACVGTATGGSASPVIAATDLKQGGFGSTFYKMYRSTNQGTLWSAASNGPSDEVTSMMSVPAGTSGQAVLAGTKTGLYKSTDRGASWSLLSNEPVVGIATAVKNGVPSVFVAGSYHLRATTDLGGTWATVSNVSGIEALYSSTDTSGNAIIYMSTYNPFSADFPVGVLRSTDFGTTWQSLLPNEVTSLAARGTKVFAATSSGVYVTDDQFRSGGQIRWTTTLQGTRVTDIITFGSKLFAAADSLGVFVSTDDGATWLSADSGLSAGGARAFASDGKNLYLGTQGSGVFRYTGSAAPDPSVAASIAPTVALGTTFWVDVKVGDPDVVTDLWDIWFDLASDDSRCTYVDSTARYGPFLTQAFLPVVPQTVTSSASPTIVHIYIKRMLADGVSGSGVVARAQFTTPVPSATTSPFDMTFSVKNIVGRNSKKERISFHPVTFAVRFIVQGVNVWPGDCNADNVVNASDILPLGLYYNATGGKSDNPGMLWQSYERQPWVTDDTPKRVHADANGDGIINSADLLAVGLNYGKSRSADVPHGVNMDKSSLAQTQADGQLSVAAAARENGALRAQLRLSTAKPVYGIAFTLKYSLNGAQSNSLRFVQADTAQSVLGGGIVFSRQFDAEGRADIAMTRTDKVGFTGDGTLLNVSIEAPAGVEDALSLEICQVSANDAKGNPVFINGSVYTKSVTGVLDALPLRNELHQNYPNPFNPSTLIQFEVSSKASVSLRIYDVLGREVTVLANGVLPAGRHSAVWDGSSCSSGVYFCVLRINEENKPAYVQTRRMMLVK